MSVPSYLGTIQKLRSEYDQLSLTPSPFLIPYGILTVAHLILYLIVPQRPSFLARVAAFMYIMSLSMYSLQLDRSIFLVYGLLIGLSSSWCVFVSANILFLYDPASEFRRRVADVRRPEKNKDNVQNPSPGEGTWEGMPDTVYKSLFWGLDLLLSLRALHWDYGSSLAAPSRPSPPPLTRKQSPFLKTLGKLLLICLEVDFLKEILALDPYFWGYIDHKPPTYILNISQSPHFTEAYRMLVAFAVIFLTVHFLATIGYLFCVNILGPPIIGPWGYDWAHHPPFGRFNAIAERGLQGWWGSWWHQWFRITITSPANALIKALDIRPDTVLARSIRVVTAFAISGVVHASGSYTLVGPSTPMGSFLFFALQPVGIAVQIMGSWILDRAGIRRSIPISVRYVVNVVFAWVWLLKTFPLMADDYARGGLWLTEPFPVSVLQMVGLGSEARSHSLWGTFEMQWLGQLRNAP